MEEILDQNNLIKPGTPAWEYAVADGRGTKDALQWRQGDWANRICPVGKDGVNNNAFENLEQYAKDVGVELKTLLGYRGVAFVFEPTLRGVGSSFSIYKALQKYPHLIHQKPKTVREAMKLVKDEDARLAAEAKARAEEAARVAAEAMAQAELLEQQEKAEAIKASQAHDEAVLYSLLTTSISKLTEADRVYTRLGNHNDALSSRVNGYIQQIEDLVLLFKTSVNSNVDEAISNLLRENS